MDSMFYSSVIPCIVFVSFFVMIFGTIALLRWFKHREIVAMVEKGILPQQYARAPRHRSGRGLMGWGIALAMLGLALMIGLWPFGFARAGMESPYPLHFGPWMLVGLIPLFIGLALLIIYFVTRKEEGRGELPSSEATLESPELLE